MADAKACPKCSRPLDHLGRCFWCEEWLCRCGRLTGSCLISVCYACQRAEETREKK